MRLKSKVASALALTVAISGVSATTASAVSNTGVQTKAVTVVETFTTSSTVLTVAEAKKIAKSNYSSKKKYFANYSSVKLGKKDVIISNGYIYDKKTKKRITNATSDTLGDSSFSITSGKLISNTGTKTLVLTIYSNTDKKYYKYYIFDGRVLKVTSAKTTSFQSETSFNAGIDLESSTDSGASAVKKVQTKILSNRTAKKSDYATMKLNLTNYGDWNDTFKITKGIIYGGSEGGTFNRKSFTLANTEVVNGLFTKNGKKVTGIIKYTPKVTTYTGYNFYVYNGKVVTITTFKGDVGFK